MKSATNGDLGLFQRIRFWNDEMKKVFGILLCVTGLVICLPASVIPLLCLISVKPGCGFAIIFLLPIAIGLSLVTAGWVLISNANKVLTAEQLKHLEQEIDVLQEK